MSKRDVSSRIVGAMRDFAARTLGDERSAEVFAAACKKAGVDPADADDVRAYVSLDAFHAVAEAFRGELGHGIVTESVAWVIPRRKDFSAMSLSAVSTPGFFYANLDRARSFYANHVSFEVSALDRESAEVTLHYRDGLPRRRETCDVARGVLMAVPLLFELPAARVEHSECYADGADTCKYAVRWRGALPYPLMGLAGGGMVTAAGAALMWHPLWFVFPVLGWLIGRAVVDRQNRHLMAEAVEEQRRALGEAERDFQRRFLEIVQLKESLQSSNEELSALHAEILEAGMQAQIGELAGELAHEIKNPLTYVLSSLQLLEEVKRPGSVVELDDMEDLVAEVRLGVNHLRGVMEWFLDACKGPGRAAPSPLDLNEEIRRAVSLLCRDWGDAVTVYSELRELPPMRAYGRQLVQVVLNLLVNAKQAPGTDNIWIDTEPVDSRVRITVRDDGRGMSADQVRRAFERGFTTKTGTGSGLGLTISKRIVENHGGEISLVSKTGEGTTLTIEVPADPKARREKTVSKTL